MNHLDLSEEAVFFDLSLDLLSVISLDGYFKRINPSFTRILGFSEAEFLSHPFLNFVHPDDHTVTLLEMEKLNAGVPTLYFENRYQTKDGSYRWLEWNASPQLDQGLVYCVARDVTQQRQIEEALRKSDERWQLALRGTNDGIWDWDVKTNEVFFSTRWKTMLGYEAHEIGNHYDEWVKRIHPEDVAWVTQAIQDHFVKKTSFYVTEHRVLCKDGTYKWVLDRGQAVWNEAGEVLRMVGSYTDITERQTLEAALQGANQELEQRVAERTAQLEAANTALRESEERNQLAMEVARMFSFEWELSTDEVKRSPHCGTILGLEALEAENDTGVNFFQRIHLNDRDRFVAIFQALTPENSIYKTTYRVVCPDGQIVTLEESGRALFDARGQLVRLIGMTADITERQRLEAELQESQVTLQRQLAEIETIYQSAPIGLNVLDTDLRFVRINEQLAEMNGIPVEAHIGRTIHELLPDMADAAEQILLPILQTGEPRLNVEIIGETPAQPGVQRVWLESFLPLKDGDRIIGISTVCEEITERNRAEAALRQSEELNRRMLESSSDCIKVLDLDGRLLYINLGGQCLMEIDNFEAFHNADWLAFWQGNNRASVEEAIATAKAGEIGRFQGYCPTAKGTPKWWDVVITPMQDADGRVAQLLAVSRDVTERKQAEEALRRSEERYRLLFETMEDGFCVIEMLFDDQTPIDYRFIEINPIFERQTGLQDAIGKTARQLIPNLEEFWFETYGRVALTGESARFENVAQAMDRWFEVYAFSIGQPENNRVAVLFKDISDRKKSETALRENEDRLRMAIASAQLGTWDWNFATGELQWDAGCKAMFGLPSDRESSIEVFFDALHPDDRDRVQSIMQVALDPVSGGSYDTEYRAIGIQDGVERWLRAKGQAYYDANGKPLRFSGTVLEITEQKRVEAQRETLLQQEQAAREAAERANRMKDEFLAVLSHELRTPLNPILGWAKLLQAAPVKPEKLQQGLTTIERNAKHQVQLIEDLLDTSRIIRGQLTLSFAKVDLSQPIVAAVETVRLAAEAKAINLEVLLDPEVGPVRGDMGRLQQTIWNLLSNAIKFTPQGGRVEVRLSRIDPLSPTDAQAPSPLSYAQITVTDTGKGITPDFLPHVFELFRQQDSSTTRSFGGLGLGLAIVRQVIEAHGGTITVTSPGEDQGSTFTLRLPLMPASSPGDDRPSNSHTLNFENLRVLVVDDEIDSLELVKVLLEDEGAIVQAVSSATAALRSLTQDQFDLLISDIGMPEMNGYAFIGQVRTLPLQSNGKIPAIALTAYAGETNQKQALAAGFQAHLAKPIDPQHLLTAIAEIIVS
ncbi:MULTISPECIES: PAS domain S-box protein [unclassified Leptolyngbya]|uniref:hybrid sensor histidine kinase/response regulator n=1 Tax=unclassified Leptolyngbya TaxID=2650499 RepID=UPI0016839FF3|nr:MULTISPECIES: PAS domain S-box protein [unclassified Leptolyngbya]MBD1909385.1 PAS domain S-box protein [Leptolyngbya sp. FACHB-8]MBD2158662.1 PAS domain S-box protein [Leptolyngbya sp. FACHB-16]